VDEEAEGKTYYIAYDIEGNRVGYIFPAAAQGYGGEIKMFVGLDLNKDITGVKIVSQSETPGLGSQIAEVKYGEKTPWFTSQFKGLSMSRLNFDNIQAVTGATVSSRAVLEGVKESIERFMPEAEDD
jgi:electron transport complex protein RnfG